MGVILAEVVTTSIINHIKEIKLFKAGEAAILKKLGENTSITGCPIAQGIKCVIIGSTN